MSRIGAETRQEQIKKWKDGVRKNIELLVAFTEEPLDDWMTEEFRSIVAGRILSLTEYLATGLWGLFDWQGLTPPPSKDEREAMEAEAAARAEAQEAAWQAKAERAVDGDPLMLPAPQAADDADNEKPDTKRNGKRKGGKK